MLPIPPAEGHRVFSHPPVLRPLLHPLFPKANRKSSLKTHAVLVHTSWQLYTGTSDPQEKEGFRQNVFGNLGPRG